MSRQQPDTGEEVTTHNALSCGEALRAHSRPPGPAALGGWRPTAHYSALCRSYRQGCGAGELHEPHSRRLVPSGANRGERRAEIDCEERAARRVRRAGASESTCGVTESRTRCGGGWRGRSLSVVGKARSRELCEALVLAHTTLQADHFRFFTTNHSRPHAAKINTTMMLHGVDEVGSSLGVDVVKVVRAFFGAGCSTADGELTLGRGFTS